MSISKRIAFFLGWDNAAHHFEHCGWARMCGCQVWCDICSEMHRLDFLHVWQHKRDYPLWLKYAIEEGRVSKEEGATFMTFIRSSPDLVSQVRIWEQTHG